MKRKLAVVAGALAASVGVSYGGGGASENGGDGRLSGMRKRCYAPRRGPYGLVPLRRDERGFSRD